MAYLLPLWVFRLICHWRQAHRWFHVVGPIWYCTRCKRVLGHE